ncbi:NfeD family protein [Geomobilimonas luticola]|uniref:Nodulation protein NfeD n=1 Tax=Geomobilimonas luticola TaxID=1114878 RepID=A0ABS5SGG5_9BACT|nr:nodulation protein NfeD [Geomobilimonas luticola]MBT0653594.1 nodulation protein NfeD [Geomobilimonas luticola]
MGRIVFFILCLLISAVGFSAEQGRIRVVGIHDPITPVTASFLHRNLQEASRDGDRMLLIELDTPGGLDTAMRSIVQDIFASPVPVAVFVAPAGARAASAGAIIALSADVCAMSPGTNIGAAHPVSIGEKPDKVMEAKIVNDAEAYVEGIARKRGRDEALARQMVRDSISLSAEKALAGRVIDLMATDRSDLLRQLDGRRINRDGRELVLKLAGAAVVPAEMGMRERILNAISNPNVAYVLLMIGMLGLFFELSNPGVILPGAIGGISLILAFFAFQTLPVNYAGVLLILLALILFIAEIKIVSHGMLTVGGVIAMVLGSLLLFESPEPYLRVSWSVILVTVVATVGFFVFAVRKVLQAHRNQPTTGREGLVGEVGVADGELTPAGGKVFVRGEYWDAWSEEPVTAGEQVVVDAVEGMRLRVRKAGTRD